MFAFTGMTGALVKELRRASAHLEALVTREESLLREFIQEAAILPHQGARDIPAAQAEEPRIVQASTEPLTDVVTQRLTVEAGPSVDEDASVDPATLPVTRGGANAISRGDVARDDCAAESTVGAKLGARSTVQPPRDVATQLQARQMKLEASIAQVSLRNPGRPSKSSLLKGMSDRG